MTSTAPEAPFALARFREGADVRLGLVAGDRIRPLNAGELGADDLNAFLTAPDWDRLGTLAVGAEGDLTVLRLEEGRFDLVDSAGNVREARQRLVAGEVVRAGVRMPIQPLITEPPAGVSPG